MSANEAEENAAKHLKYAEAKLDLQAFNQATSEALIGIGWAILAIARKR